MCQLNDTVAGQRLVKACRIRLKEAETRRIGVLSDLKWHDYIFDKLNDMLRGTTPNDIVIQDHSP